MNAEKIKNIQVVFVEDYTLIRVSISSLLNNVEGIEVVAQAEDAEQGLAHVRTFNPDIVLMDLGLPGCHGIEAIRRIKALNREVKVIVLTSHNDEESFLAALSAGANAYCLKDIPTDRLVEVIRMVSEGAFWLDPAIAERAIKQFSIHPVFLSYDGKEHDQPISLGAREHEVLRLLTQGKKNNEIAEELYVSVHTVKAQVSTLLQKLAVHDRVQAAVKAIQSGLVHLDTAV